MADESLSTQTFEVAKKVWATALVRGILFFVVGLVMFVWPDVGQTVLQWLLAIVFVLQAVVMFIEASRTKEQDSNGSTIRMILAGVAVVAAIAVVAWPEATFTIILRIVGIWALVAGLIGLFSSVKAYRERRAAWDWELTTSLLWTFFGLLVLVKPLENLEIVIVGLSVFLIFTGIVLTVAGFAVHVAARDVAKGRTPSEAPSETASAPAPTAHDDADDTDDTAARDVVGGVVTGGVSAGGAIGAIPPAAMDADPDRPEPQP